MSGNYRSRVDAMTAPCNCEAGRATGKLPLMRRIIFVLTLLLGVVSSQAESPERGKPERSVDQVQNRTWFDVKKGTTHVEVDVFYWEVSVLPPSKAITFEVPEFKKVMVIEADFVTRGYRTDPPDRVQIGLDTDASEIELINGNSGYGIFKRLSIDDAHPESSCGRFPIPAKLFSEWVATERPGMKIRGELRELGSASRDAFRNLSRGMIARRALTFYFGRESHTATTLNDGRVLVAGGYDGFRALKNCEMYDPATGRFATGLKMQLPRRNHTATLLKDGRVLIAGGGIAGGDTALDSAELFDPVTNRFSPVGKMRDARMSHTATLFNDGRVLIVGGGGKTPLAGAEFYDPVTNSFHPTGGLNHRRLGHTATLLKNGRVLIIGGADGNPLSSIEMFEPNVGLFTSEGNLQSPLWDHAATLLPDGRVLLTGGNDGSGHASGCVFRIDPVKKEYWTKFCPSAFVVDFFSRWAVDGCGAAIGNSDERWGQVAVSLPDDRVLIAGGYGALSVADNHFNRRAKFKDGDQTSCIVYNSKTNGLVTNHGFLLSPRRHLAAATLKDGRVLLIGGLNDNNPALNTAEFYDPKTDEIIPWRDVVNGEK